MLIDVYDMLEDDNFDCKEVTIEDFDKRCAAVNARFEQALDKMIRVGETGGNDG